MKKKLLPPFLLLTILSVLTLACLNPRNNPIFRKLAKDSDERIVKQTEKDLKESPVLQEIDRLCTQEIPAFEGFRLVRRVSWKSRNPFLSYSYSSNTDFQAVRSFYKDYFSRNGWQLRHDQVGGWGPPWHATWRNKEYSISIEFMPGEESNYGFFCQKLLYPDETLH
jgi:hypothetical protein